MTHPTAHDKLYEAMAGGWSLTQAEAAELHNVIDAGLAIHAHELAEKQRALADANDELDHDHHRYAFSPAVREAADHIDPEVQP